MAVGLPAVTPRQYCLSVTLQLALAAIFFSEAFSYTVVDPYLPAAFPTAGNLLLSMLFSSYSIAQLVVGIILLLVQLTSGAARMLPHHDALIASSAFLGFTLASTPPVVFPESLAVMFVQRALLGTCAAGFFIYSYRGIARAFEPQVALKAAACINADSCSKDVLTASPSDHNQQPTLLDADDGKKPVGHGSRQPETGKAGTNYLHALVAVFSNRQAVMQLVTLVWTQAVRCLITILLPISQAGLASWVVPASFGVQAVCAIFVPFLIERGLRVWPKARTYGMMVLLSVVLAAAGSYILVPSHAAATRTAEALISGSIPSAAFNGDGATADPGASTAGAAVHVMVMGALFGCAYAGMEVLVYKHVTDLLAASDGQLAVDVGAMAYASFYNVGNLVGGMVVALAVHRALIHRARRALCPCNLIPTS
eukprot:gene13862-13984_t